MADREIPPATLEGWYALHQLFRLSWRDLKGLAPPERRERGREMAGLLREWRRAAEGGWSAAYRLAGSGADYLFVHFRPALEGLSRARRRLQASALGDHLELTDDYVSVVELGLYALSVELLERLESEGRAGDREAWEEAVRAARAEQAELKYVRQRLQPEQPDDMPYVCFYPMSKRRTPERNWYALPLRERARLMQVHGSVGRNYADRISQVISGSVGLDDWEWAVTLFGRDPLDFKEVVTEMRYDRVSAEYAEFGRFHVGKRMEPDEWAEPRTW